MFFKIRKEDENSAKQYQQKKRVVVVINVGGERGGEGREWGMGNENTLPCHSFDCD